MAETNATRENKMGVMPMNRLLISMASPMMLSMLVQAFYNIVDSFFVARIKDGEGEAGTSALSALGMAFPFQMLMIAFAGGLCVGVNAVLSKALGERIRTPHRRLPTTASSSPAAIMSSFCS